MSLSREEQSILDDGLLASDSRFCQHLCLVPLPDDGPPKQRRADPAADADAPGVLAPQSAASGVPAPPGAAGPVPPPPGNVVESRRLWPALRFDSFADLVVHAGSVPNAPAASSAVLKGKLTVQYQRLRRSAGIADASGHGVAYLLYHRPGRAGEAAAVVIVPKNDGGRDGKGGGEPATYDFYAHCCEMEYPGEDCPHVASGGFQDAFQRVSRRMEESLEGGAGGGAPCCGTPGRGAVMTTVTSGRKAFESAADGDRKPAADGAPAGEAGRADGYANRYRAEEAPAGAAPKHPAVKEEAPATASKEKPAAADRGAHSDSPEGPVRSVVFSDVEKNMSSPLSSLSCEMDKPAEPLVLPWKEMNSRMKSQGWTHFPGSGLQAWIYVHPSCKGMKKAEVLKMEKNVHWFDDDGEVKRYAKRQLGWVDAESGYVSGGTPKSESSAENAAERIKKRAGRRASKAAKTSSLAVDEVAVEKSAARAASRSRNPRKDEPPKPAGKKKEPPKKAGNRAKKQAKHARANGRGRVSISPPTEKKVAAKAKAAKAKAEKKPAARKPAARKPAAGAQRPPSTPAPAASSAASVGDDSRFSAESPASRTRGSERARFESARAAALHSSPSDSSTSTDSVDECYQVLPSREGWTRLMSYYGFTYSGGKYCYPGNENRPGKDSNAEEGVHYFGSIEGVRRHLCAYGLPGEIMMVEQDTRDELNRWIRYANVRNLDDGAMINPRDIPLIDFREAWLLMQKCGFKWSNCYTYKRPKSRDWPHLPEVFKFESNQEMHKHLARFGVPNELEGREMDRLTRLSLDLYIVGDYDGDERQVNTL